MQHFPSPYISQTPSNSPVGYFRMGINPHAHRNQRDIAGSYSSANPRPNTRLESQVFPSSPSYPICSPRQISFSFVESTQRSVPFTENAVNSLRKAEKEASQPAKNVEFSSANSDFKFIADPALLRQTEGLAKYLSGGSVRKKIAPGLNLCPRYFEKFEGILKSLVEKKDIFNALVSIFSEYSVAENHSSQPDGSRFNKVKTLAKINDIDRTCFAQAVSMQTLGCPPATSTEADRLELSICPDGDKCAHVHPNLCHCGIAGGDGKSSLQQSVFMDPKIIFLKTHKRADNGCVVENYPMLDSYDEIEGLHQLTIDTSNPNESTVSLRNVPSSKILVNRGSVEHLRLIVRHRMLGAAASEGAAVPIPPAPLCAHFSKNGMCCMGNACGFIHLVGHRLEPDANQKQKQAPKEKKSHRNTGNGSTPLNFAFTNSVNPTLNLSRQHLGMHPIQHQYQPMQVPNQQITMIPNTSATPQPFFTSQPAQHGTAMFAFHQPNPLVQPHDGLYGHSNISVNQHIVCSQPQCTTPSQMYQPQPQPPLVISHPPHQHIAMGPTLQPIQIAPVAYTSYSVPPQLPPPHLHTNQAYGPTMIAYAHRDPSVPQSSVGLLPDPTCQYGAYRM